MKTLKAKCKHWLQHPQLLSRRVSKHTEGCACDRHGHAACVKDVRWTLLLSHSLVNFSFNEHSWEAECRTLTFYCCFLVWTPCYAQIGTLSVCVCEILQQTVFKLDVSAALSQRIMSWTLYVKMTKFSATVPLFQWATCLHIYSFCLFYCESRENLELRLPASFKLAARRRQESRRNICVLCKKKTNSNKQYFDSFQHRLKATVFLKKYFEINLSVTWSFRNHSNMMIWC